MIAELVRWAFGEAVSACDPARRVAAALAHEGDGPWIGIAAGKAALAMARGAPVDRGIAVTGGAPGAAPPGWRAIAAGHPDPDERSVDAGRAVRALVGAATADQRVLALVSGGASAMLELPRVPLAELRAIVHALMAGGAPIHELNAVRGALSELKAGQLAAGCAARILTLVTSDVVGDDLAVIGSGPTIGPWLAQPGAPVDVGALAEQRRCTAIEILDRHAIAVPPVLARPIASRFVTRDDRAVLIAGLAAFAEATRDALATRGIPARWLEEPLAGDVAQVAARLAAEPAPFVAHGEPTLIVPADHGEGGRAQQLALMLARAFRGTTRAALVAGSDGIDGPRPRVRPAPAGAFVDGDTWEAIRAAGIDPDAALARCDAGTALDAAGALFVPGPTGVNHADVVIGV